METDGVTLAVLTKRFEGIVRKMTNTLFRTARSGVISSARDFSCCVLTQGDELLVTAESLPIHVMSGPDLICKVMKEFHPNLKRGDAFLHNSPYHGNSHAGDHCLLAPVIDAEGTHRFTVLVKAHVADCGNSAPSSYMPTARDVYEEGAVVFPCVKIQEDYEDVLDVVRMCQMRIRVPEQWRGDYLGLLGAVRIGERELLELGSEVGWGVLADYTHAWFEYSERHMIRAIRRLPAGVAVATNAHDPFPGAPGGIPITVRVEVRPDEATIEIDLRENPDCLPCGLNLTEATAQTAAMIGVFNSIDHTVPPNAGSFRRLKILLRENCVAGIPRHPASCSLATTGVADRVANAVQRGLASLGDGIGMAEAGLCIPASSAVISGRDPRHGDSPFVNMLILGQTGGAGGPSADGWLNLAHVGNAGLMRRDSVEIDELRHPIRIHVSRIVPDSEGAGRFRGAPSAYVEYGPVGCAIEALWSADGSANPALGARGGGAGGTAQQQKRQRDGTLVELNPWDHVTLESGETLVSVSCGGGGYGSPLDRDPVRVVRDISEGWITSGRAESVYGVVLDERGHVDSAATETRRTGLLAAAEIPSSVNG
jgi:N-methylhydantoinase B/oxoprolinase/acetone carboxylase alpha subunit